MVSYLELKLLDQVPGIVEKACVGFVLIFTSVIYFAYSPALLLCIEETNIQFSQSNFCMYEQMSAVVNFMLPHSVCINL